MQKGKELTLTTLGRGIVKHPLLLISPVVIVMGLLVAYATEVSLYRSSAIVAFENLLDSNSENRSVNTTDQTKTRLVRSLLIGEPLRRIVRRSWPEVDQREDPIRFNQRMQQLRSTGGLELEFKRDNPNALTVGFTSRSPQEAFSVVKASVDTLLALSEEETKKRLEKSSSFLLKEQDANRKKLSEIEESILKLRSGIPESALRKYDQERVVLRNFPSVVASVSGDPTAGREEVLSELKIRVAAVEKEYERLQRSLDEKPESARSDPELFVNIDSDARIKQLNQEISVKEQQLNAMIFKGLRDAHPQRKNLEAEISSMKVLREKRAEELMNGSPETTDLVLQKRTERIRAKMEEKKQEIEDLREKIRVLESVQEESEKVRESLDQQLGELSQQTSRLAQLESERALTIESYNQISKRLEGIEREGRVEEDDAGLRLSVVERPRIPTRPLPLAHLPLLLMGLCISLASGVALVLLVESLDSTVSNAKELQRVVTLPILGAIDAMVTKEELAARSRRLKLAFACLFLFLLLAKPICRWFIG